MKPPRERAARALCDHHGNPSDTRFEGRPMWESYLPEVDAVLKAALTPEQFATMNAESPATR
ncbi:MAG: hypothetical protein IE912_03345 [Brevundimonas diminuta]|nr:hypothetical protein [Brevundimonas diminuta]MBD3817937.1 hypothetical protein [Brevundimonas diminuta]